MEDNNIPPPPSGKIIMPKNIPPPPSGDLVMPETDSQKKSQIATTTPLESKRQDGAKVLSDVSEQSKQGVEPLSQPTEKKEPSKLPETYVSNRSNYKDLVEGQDYILNRGGKPITGKWDATKQEFVKNPLLDTTPKDKRIS